MIRTPHLLRVVAIATLSGLFGLLWLFDGPVRDFGIVVWVTGASWSIWIPVSRLFLDRAWGTLAAIQIGVLSPFLGCLLVLPPWSFLVVFSEPIFSVSLGVVTSLAVHSVSRRFRE